MGESGTPFRHPKVGGTLRVVLSRQSGYALGSSLVRGRASRELSLVFRDDPNRIPEILLMPSSDRPRWLSIYSRPLLKQEAYEVLDEEEREKEIHLQWGEFIERDLPRMAAALKGEAWIRE